ncbi:MAG: transcription-repair coupling factor, partial [Thermomicrobiaceae bacterium]|nr:transcription-repair coupling factor [Thermomicrobiaceae bacterium]
TWEIAIGQRLPVERFIAALLDAGYDLVPTVQEPGQVSRRGGIIDVFPPADEHAVRIDLFGDEIDSLRLVDPASQRSVGRADRVTIVPPLEISLAGREGALAGLQALDVSDLRTEVRDEWERNVARLERGEVGPALDLFAPYLVPEPASLVEYLPPEHLVVVVEPSAVHLSLGQLEAQAEELRAALEEAGELPRGLLRPYLPWDDLRHRLGATRQLALGPLPAGWAPPAARPLEGPAGFALETSSYAGQVEPMIAALRDLLAGDWIVVAATEQSERLTEVLEEHDIFPRLRKRGASGAVEPPRPGTIEVVHSRLSGGWRHEGERVVVLTDLELYGYHRATQPTVRRRPARTPGLLEQLAPGAYV